VDLQSHVSALIRKNLFEWHSVDVKFDVIDRHPYKSELCLKHRSFKPIRELNTTLLTQTSIWHVLASTTAGESAHSPNLLPKVQTRIYVAHVALRAPAVLAPRMSATARTVSTIHTLRRYVVKIASSVSVYPHHILVATSASVKALERTATVPISSGRASVQRNSSFW
jgi:hypothetical protein